MNQIKTIDLWTEQHKDHYECFNGAFVDGFSENNIPFNSYKIVKNCNCEISVSKNEINISNKHNAIVFYKNNIPVRLVVINRNTQIEKCIDTALNQYFGNSLLKDIFNKNNITSSIIDLNENPVYNKSNKGNEIDVGSCDRWNLLYNMLKGSYTESATKYGNFQSDKYEFLPDIEIKYLLKLDTEEFIIEHKCAFINEIKTRIIPIQENSKLTREGA